MTTILLIAAAYVIFVAFVLALLTAAKRADAAQERQAREAAQERQAGEAARERQAREAAQVRPAALTGG